MKNRHNHEVGSLPCEDVHPENSISNPLPFGRLGAVLTGALLLTASPLQADPVHVRVTVENLMPENGSLITPAWIGFHDGNFDFFDAGSSASMALERLAEDGNPSGLSESFTTPDSNRFDGVLDGIGPISPGGVTHKDFFLDDSDPAHRFFSYAAMVIPSNDAFVSNMEPIKVFDEMGNLMLDAVQLGGATVLDAGTEQNTEIPEATPLLGQMMPNTGSEENDVVRMHDGFKARGMGGILDQPMFMEADFKQPDYPLFALNARHALQITSFNLTEDALEIQWMGAFPPYQIQMKAQAGASEWTNVGMPTEETTVSLPRDGSQGFFRVVSAEHSQMNDTAKFQLTFHSTWSAATHPDMFPGNPHFSGLIGATHNQNGQLWEPGSLASPGIESMAETGSKSPLMDEIQQAIQMGWADGLISGGGIGFSPGSVSVEFEASAAHPLLSLVSMIAPSPDWFVGVHGVDLRPGGQWIDTLTLELASYDAGTDNGTTYTSPNAEPVTHDPITTLVSAPVIHEGMVPSFGHFVIRRVE